MNLALNLVKSTFLAASIFWLIIFSKEADFDMLMFVVLSLIPIFICVSFVIISSICTIFWLNKNKDYKTVFRLYFPYYTITVFSLCVVFIVTSNFENITTAFFTSVFITTNQSWVWFSKNTKT